MTAPDAAKAADEERFKRLCMKTLEGILKANATAAPTRAGSKRQYESATEHFARAAVKTDDDRWCREKILLGARYYDTMSELTQIAGSASQEMKRVFERENRLCPSGKPIPDTLSKLPYQSTRSEWTSDPGWSCIKWAIDSRQEGQYELKSDLSQGTFSVIGRARNPLGKIVELTFSGRVEGGTVVLDKSTTTELP